VFHQGSECYCPSPPCGTTACADGLDNDDDGWVDEADPDCLSGQEETGFGDEGCNDGLDNDGDDAIDSADGACASASDDEVLGDGACVDVCAAGVEGPDGTCTLWDAASMGWIEDPDDGDGHMHNRARVYDAWLRERLLPAGGVMRGYFTDDSYEQVVSYGGERDSAIWTGAYLAAQSLRFSVTEAPDAELQMNETIRVLDRWWRISGDKGYLARYAAPASSPQPVIDIFDPAISENHRNVPFESDTWHWKGDVSRDQYQGAMLGYAMAYDATNDDALKEMIRSHVVDLVEVLMTQQTRTIKLSIDGLPLTREMTISYAVYTDDETPGGTPQLTITTNPLDVVDDGMLVFWPNPSEYLRQIPLLNWLPDIYLRSQAIQLGSMFAIALHVTDGVPTYDGRRQAILDHYLTRADYWIDLATGWTNSNECGESYHGLNIAFMPMYGWARLETDPVRKARLQTEVLRDAMWAEVWDHKNVFFGYIYASQAHPNDDPGPTITFQTDQLRLFPGAPSFSRAVDNTGSYTEDPSCSGLSAEAIDVDERVPTSFLWERNPWKLFDAGNPNLLYPGIDYLLTYWMARHYGYLEDDAADTCLRWRADLDG